MTENNNNDYFKSKEFINNLRLFEEAQKVGKSCILGSDELVDIAEYYFESGFCDKGKKVAEYATSLYPDSSAPLLFLACFYMNTIKDMNRAKAFIDKVTDKNTPEYFITLAEYYLNIEEKKKAIETLHEGEKSEDIDDEDYFIIDATNLLYDFGMIEVADEWKEKYAEKDSIYYLKLQARSENENGNKSKAIEILEKVIDKNPFCTDNWILLSSVQLMADRYSDAATSAEYAIAIDDKCPAAYQNLGNAFFKMCNYSKALEAYEKYSILCDNEMTYLLKARCFFCLQETDKAYNLLQKAKEKCIYSKANKADIYKDLAIVCGWKNQPEEAYGYINWLKKNNFMDAELSLIEGGVLLAAQKIEQANDVFSEGYELAKDKMEYLFQVGVAFYEHHLDTPAYLLFKEIFDKDPDRSRGLAYYAIVCNYLGLKEEFLKNLELATTKNPDESKAVLGEIFPQGMEPYDYLEYAKRNLGKQ